MTISGMACLETWLAFDVTTLEMFLLPRLTVLSPIHDIAIYVYTFILILDRVERKKMSFALKKIVTENRVQSVKLSIILTSNIHQIIYTSHLTSVTGATVFRFCKCNMFNK